MVIQKLFLRHITKFVRVSVTVMLSVAMTGMSGPWVSRATAGDWMPLLPDQDFYDFQLFAPPDLGSYNMYRKNSDGIFFDYDRLYWAVTPPSVVPVAQSQTGEYLFPTSPISPDTIVQLNNANIAATAASTPDTTTGESVLGGLYTFGGEPYLPQLNTSWMRTAMGWGNRYEGGWVYEGKGVKLNYFDTKTTQEFNSLNEFAAASPTQVYQNETTGGGGDGAGGGGVGNVNQALTVTNITSESPPPDHLIAQKLQQTNTTEIWSTSAIAMIRKSLGRRSRSELVFGLGPRFMQFRDIYNVGYESNQFPFAPETSSSVGGGGGNTGGAVNTNNW